MVKASSQQTPKGDTTVWQDFKVALDLFREAGADDAAIGFMRWHVLHDRLSFPVHNTYLFTHTGDNELSVLHPAFRLWRDRMTRRLLVSSYEPNPLNWGYPGYKSWEKALLDHGVDERDIHSVFHPQDQGLNTNSEAIAFVAFAKERRIKEVAFISTIFHQPRAIINIATVAMRNYPNLRIQSIVGDVLPWNEKVKHSQGTTVGTRRELVRGEWDRIVRYTAKGDIAPIGELKDYFSSRE